MGSAGGTASAPCSFFATTAWLAWGASLALIGLFGGRSTPPRPALDAPQPRTVIAVPICNEDPLTTFARIAAIDRSVTRAGVTADFVVLSDTRDDALAGKEQFAFARLLRETDGQGRIFYRRRRDNAGRKAGNIEEFMRSSGGAYDLAVILDADSLMEGETIRAMIARMQADPQLGLLQTLPKIIGARSFFGRALQFASWFSWPDLHPWPCPVCRARRGPSGAITQSSASAPSPKAVGCRAFRPAALGRAYSQP
ncbi:glycosyltransferase [Sulfitobacter sp. W074]|uniref:glycosyltransferase n=1 Tax=Sulfitobacter sp. W074 TaxID=2867026 RepID=UPI002883166B|nr:glycosyltransferase [Sulfitobacter sp. W074]